MPQATTDLVKDLTLQLNRFNRLRETFGFELQGDDLEISVSLSYSSLRFSIHKSNAIYFQYTLQQGVNGKSVADCYFHDKQKIEALKNHFKSLADGNTSMSPISNSGDVIYTDELTKYLIIAESIASSTYLCASGDDYRPGYFSEIIVQAESIMLKQINHMNAKSLDHKMDYSLRDLQFFIPLKQLTEKNSVMMDEDYIGVMCIFFSDRSSQNNKRCGDQVQERIEEEKAKFNNNR